MCLSPRLDYDSADPSAFDDIGPGTQHRERVRRIDQNQITGVDAD